MSEREAGSGATTKVEASEERARPLRRPAPSERWNRLYKGAVRVGYLLAILFHALLFLWFRSVDLPEPSLTSARGPAAGDVRAGGGGGMQQVTFRVARPEEEQEDPEPEPEVTEQERVAPPEPSRADRGLLGEEAGSGSGEGEGEASGEGEEGGGGGEGEEGTLPVPRGMILPPQGYPGSVRGQEITVWVFVDVRGRVVPDSTRLDPPTPDRGYNRKLVSRAAAWSFDPATRRGRPVAAWYPFEILFY
ncbi:MAG: hypothetical protein ACREKN_07125 [Longimicrobiaceae bacterium]